MDTKRKVLAFGAASLLVMGVIALAGATEIGKAGLAMRGGMGWGGGKHMPWGNSTSLGLPADATRGEVSDALWEKSLKDLGLTASSTVTEYRQAMKAKMQAMEGQRMQEMRTKLKLPDNATADDIQTSMRQWRTDNKGLMQGIGGPRGCGMRGLGPGRQEQESDSQ